MPNGDFWTSAPPNWHRERELDRLRQALERAGIPAKGAVRPPLPSYAQRVEEPSPTPLWQQALTQPSALRPSLPTTPEWARTKTPGPRESLKAFFTGLNEQIVDALIKAEATGTAGGATWEMLKGALAAAAPAIEPAIVAGKAGTTGLMNLVRSLQSLAPGGAPPTRYQQEPGFRPPLSAEEAEEQLKATGVTPWITVPISEAITWLSLPGGVYLPYDAAQLAKLGARLATAGFKLVAKGAGKYGAEAITALERLPGAATTELGLVKGIGKRAGKVGKEVGPGLKAIENLAPEHKTVIINNLKSKLGDAEDIITSYNDELMVLQESLKDNPANKLLDIIPKVGGQKGTIDILTPTQFQLLHGASWQTQTMKVGGKAVSKRVLVNTVPIPPGVRDAQGRIRFDYAADELASRLYPEAGVSATDKLRNEILRAKGARERIRDLKITVGNANEDWKAIKGQLDYLERFKPQAGIEPIAARTSVQAGLGIGEKPQPVKMLEEFKDIGRKQTLIDEEAIRARAAAKPLPGQLGFEAPPTAPAAEAVAPGVAKEPWQMTKEEFLASGVRAKLGKRTGEYNITYPGREKEISLGGSQESALIQAHYSKVVNASAQGKPVPPEVLKDYPDLAARVAKAPAEVVVSPSARAEITAKIEERAGMMTKRQELLVAVPAKTPELRHENLSRISFYEGQIARLDGEIAALQAGKELRGGYAYTTEINTLLIKQQQGTLSKADLTRLRELEGVAIPKTEAIKPTVEALGAIPKVEVPTIETVADKIMRGQKLTLEEEQLRVNNAQIVEDILKRRKAEGEVAGVKAPQGAVAGGVPPTTGAPPPGGPVIPPGTKGFRLPDVPPSAEYITALRQAHPERLKAATEPLETVNGAYRLVLNAREIGDNTIAYVESYVMKYGDPGKLFGLTPEGMVTRVGNPGNRSLAYVDVLENYAHYTLTPQQRDIAQTLGNIYKAGRELALKNGIKIGELPALDEWWQYVARKVTGRVNPLTGKVEPGYTPIGAFKMRGKISAQKQRVFDEMLKGTEEGISYAGPMDTLRAYLRGIYRLIGNKQAERLLLTVTRRGRPQLNERVVSGFVSPQGIGEKYPIWTSRVAQMDVANAIDKVFAYQATPSALRITSQTSGALVGQVAAVDISGPFIQGLNTLGHDISMAIRGRPSAKFARLIKAQFDILAQPKSMDSFRRLHAVTYLEAIQDGVMTTPFEMVAGTSIAGRVLGKVPVAGKALQTGYEHIWGRFGKAFSGPLEQARILMYEQMAPAFVAEGRSSIEAAEMANLLTGVVSTKALGVSTAQRMAEQTALFAPRFFRANLSVMKYLFKSGKTASEMRWAVGSLLGAGAAIYTAMSLAMGQKPKLNPAPKRFGGDGAEFMTIKLGNNYFGIGGWWYAWTKMLAELGSMAVYDPKALVQPNESHPIWKFIRSRASPPVSLIQELVQGEDFMGRELRGPTDYLYQMTEGLTPIWAQSLVKPDPRRDIARAGLEFTGGRTIPLSDLDKLALQKHNVTWDELDFGTKGRLEKTPEVRKILAESPMRREQRLNTEARLKLYDQKVEQDKWRDRGTDAFGNPFTAKQWREKRTEFYIRQSQDIATRERLLGPFKDRKPKNEKEQALQDYYKIGDRYQEEANQPGRGGQVDVGALVQEQEKFLAGLSPALEGWLLEQLGGSGTPVDDEFRQDKRVIKPYWGFVDAIKEKYTAQEKAVNLLLAQRVSPTLWPQPIKNYIKYMQAQGQAYRMRNPQVDALLVKWGYFQNPQNPLNKMREKQRELRAVAGVR